MSKLEAEGGFILSVEHHPQAAPFPPLQETSLRTDLTSQSLTIPIAPLSDVQLRRGKLGVEGS